VAGLLAAAAGMAVPALAMHPATVVAGTAVAALAAAVLTPGRAARAGS
jgi:hypothetical protein